MTKLFRIFYVNVNEQYILISIIKLVQINEWGTTLFLFTGLQ